MKGKRPLRQCPRCRRFLKRRQKACRPCKWAHWSARKRLSRTVAQNVGAVTLPIGLQQLAARLAEERGTEPAELRALAERLGLALLDGRKPEVPEPSQEQQLARLCALRGTPAYNRAAQRFILRNLPLAKSYARRWAREGIDQEELEQQATIGLMQAVEAWDPGRKTAFSSYAIPKMRHAVSRYVQKKLPMVHVPQNVLADRRLVERARRKQPGASPAELARAAGISEDRVRRALGANPGIGYDEPDERDGEDAGGMDLELRDLLRRALGGEVAALEEVARRTGKTFDEVVAALPDEV